MDDSSATTTTKHLSLLLDAVISKFAILFFLRIKYSAAFLRDNKDVNQLFMSAPLVGGWMEVDPVEVRGLVTSSFYSHPPLVERRQNPLTDIEGDQ